ncbi:MAG TPA: DNA/RNA non-specific endonuclease [Gemmataceae bacterium]|jgi:endonuclease G|nr:DNA/RNA non-specific endonuclease [Gemmataceae bacterium]
MDRRLSQTLTAAVLVAAAVLIVLILIQNPGFQRQQPLTDSAPAEASVHLTLGNPSGATDNPDDADNFLMRKPYYALSYNNAKGTPNWVSWQVQVSDLGDAPRPQFYPDPDLPRSFKHVTPRDYAGSGFDRGHMCPHSDRGATPEASTATFAMTNIVPQAPNENQRAWADFEDYCRGLVRKRHAVLYIVSGPQGRGGEGTRGPADTIADGKVTVPARCWKVVVVVDDGAGGPDDVSRIGPRTRVIAINMPNDQSVGHGWAKYRTNVREIEELTGYTFFGRVPADIADGLKAKADTEHVPPSRPRRTKD